MLFKNGKSLVESVHRMIDSPPQVDQNFDNLLKAFDDPENYSGLQLAQLGDVVAVFGQETLQTTAGWPMIRQELRLLQLTAQHMRQQLKPLADTRLSFSSIFI